MTRPNCTQIEGSVRKRGSDVPSCMRTGDAATGRQRPANTSKEGTEL